MTTTTTTALSTDTGRLSVVPRLEIHVPTLLASEEELSEHKRKIQERMLSSPDFAKLNRGSAVTRIQMFTDLAAKIQRIFQGAPALVSFGDQQVQPVKLLIVKSPTELNIKSDHGRLRSEYEALFTALASTVDKDGSGLFANVLIEADSNADTKVVDGRPAHQIFDFDPRYHEVQAWTETQIGNGSFGDKIGKEAAEFFDYARKVIQTKPGFSSLYGPFTDVLLLGSRELMCLKRASSAQVAAEATGLQPRVIGLADDQAEYFYNRIVPEATILGLLVTAFVELKDPDNPRLSENEIKARLIGLHDKIKCANAVTIAKDIAKRAGQLEMDDSPLSLVLVTNQDMPTAVNSLTKSGKHNCVVQGAAYPVVSLHINI